MWTTEAIVSGWYYIAILLFMVVGIYGTYEHKTILPLLWAGVTSVILYAYSGILATFIFGFQYYATYSFEWFIVTIFGCLFATLNIIYGYNVVTKGTVIE